jgi:sRNA-binding carbon storage regulator CsrA
MSRTYHSKANINALKDLRILRDEIVASMPKGKTKQDLMNKARNRTDLDHWNDAISGTKQLRLL